MLSGGVHSFVQVKNKVFPFRMVRVIGKNLVTCAVLMAWFRCVCPPLTMSLALLDKGLVG